MILHALLLLARDMAIGMVGALVFSLAIVGLILVCRQFVRRADARYLRDVEKERQRNREQLRDHERRRSEIRCMGGSHVSADERWVA